MPQTDVGTRTPLTTAGCYYCYQRTYGLKIVRLIMALGDEVNCDAWALSHSVSDYRIIR